MEERKKILIFSLAYYPRVGGAEVAIKEIAERIADIEWHLVTMRFAADEALEEQMGRVRVYRVGGGRSYFSKILFIPRAAAAAARLHRQLGFSGAWAMMSYMVLPLVLLRWRGIKLPYALTLQEGDTYAHMFARLRILPFVPLLNSGFRRARVISAISTYLGGWARMRGYRGPLEVIPNGVDLARFAQPPAPAAVHALEDALGKKMGDVFLVTTSRLVRKNALDDVIRALPALPQNVRFIVVGEGPEEAALRRLARRRRVAGRVEFVGAVGHDELPAYLYASDIFIRPSRSEGMGNSFIEAMAAGLPVVATQAGGIADFLFDERRNPEAPVTGWAVDPNAPSQIAETIETVMREREKTRAVVATARRMAAEKYDWALIARQMRERVFARLLH